MHRRAPRAPGQHRAFHLTAPPTVVAYSVKVQGEPKNWGHDPVRGVGPRWQPLLFLTISGRRSSRCCRPSHLARRAVGPGCRIGSRWQASSSRCGPASSGGTSPRSWAAAARPAGGGWSSGTRPGSGRRCTGSCSSACAGPTASTGAGPRSTAPPCGLKGGRGDRAQSDGPRQGGHQAPLGRRRRGYAARPDAQPGQPARQPHARPDTTGCGPPRSGPPGQATSPSWHTPRRQGLRPPPLPPRVPRSRHRAPHRPARDR